MHMQNRVVETVITLLKLCEAGHQVKQLLHMNFKRSRDLLASAFALKRDCNLCNSDTNSIICDTRQPHRAGLHVLSLDVVPSRS